MSIFLMGSGEWGLETGDWGLGTGDWGLETGDWRVGSRKRTADVGTSCPLTAFRICLLFFSNDLNNQLANRESGIGNRKADSRQRVADSREWGLGNEDSGIENREPLADSR